MGFHGFWFHASSGPVSVLRHVVGNLGRVLLGVGVAGGVLGAMLDPETDDPEQEWCYLGKSTTVIGVPYMPDAVQVTFDGALYTRHAELCFFYGDPLRPVLVRQKTFLDGWIPVVQAGWRDGPVRYDLEMFGAVLEGGSASNTLQFVRVKVRNPSAEPARAVFAAALRHSGQDTRSGRTEFSPDWRYEMSESSVFRDGRLVYCFPPGARRERVPGVAYEQAFVGADEFVTERAEVCLTRYDFALAAGEERELVFKMPRVPVPLAETGFREGIEGASHAIYRERTVRFWRDLLGKGAQFDLPEPRLNAAWRASLVHLLLATRERGGERFQTSGLPYPDFFMIDFVDMRLAYDGTGHPEFAAASFPQIFKRQLEDGLFCDTSLSHGAKLWSSHGHMVYALAHHYLMTRDREQARSLWPALRRAIEWTRQARAADAFGLMPPAWPYDAEMILGRYTSHNLWNLLGLRTAIRMARDLGEAADAETWQLLHDAYLASFLQALDASVGTNGYVPTGLYSFITGPAARAGFAEYQTDQDWENMLLVYPTEVLGPTDPRVAATLSAIRRDRYREGIMTYRNGQHLHQYVTANLIEQYLLLGEAELALRDFYHLLLHSGSTHEGFENMVEPWQDRRVTIDCPPPHAWAAAKIVQLTRNLLVVEHGGRAGLDPGQRDLHLFSVLSPAWAIAGQEVAFRNVPTEMGRISARLTFTSEGARITIASHFHDPPRDLVVRVPWFVELLAFRSDAARLVREGDWLRLSPDATWLHLDWREKPGVHDRTFQDLLWAYRKEVGFWEGPRHAAPTAPAGWLTAEEERLGPARLSFATALAAFRQESARRLAELVARGEKPVVITAPALWTVEERKAAFQARFGGVETNLTTGKRASASSSLPAYPPARAVDGRLELSSSWQADPYPQTFALDLEAAHTLTGLHVWTYWGGGRYYRYTVEVSVDGDQWTLVGDRRTNTQPATELGDRFDFAPRAVRFIRVQLLYHSLNPGVHLVEIKAYEPSPSDPP
jgi:hypothetical protein